jgi:hypothetical protein
MSQHSNLGKVGQMNRGQALHALGKCKKNGDTGSNYYFSVKERLAQLSGKN